MPLNIRNEAVNQLAKKLAVRKHLNKTEAVKVALENVNWRGWSGLTDRKLARGDRKRRVRVGHQ